mgnify:CR=1 FL=1
MPNPTRPRQLHVPEGYSLATLLWSHPADAPVPDPKLFVGAVRRAEPEDLRRLCAWIEPQATCDRVISEHGVTGLSQILRSLAAACAVATDVHMQPRVRAVAEFHGLA